jgi:hypothetical protein
MVLDNLPKSFSRSVPVRDFSGSKYRGTLAKYKYKHLNHSGALVESNLGQHTGSAVQYEQHPKIPVAFTCAAREDHARAPWNVAEVRNNLLESLRLQA